MMSEPAVRSWQPTQHMCSNTLSCASPSACHALPADVLWCLLSTASTPCQVRWAACQALGQMCTDLGPDLQMRCGTAVLPALLEAMDDFQNPRVQVRVCLRLNG
jgi:hypothetical protein